MAKAATQQQPKLWTRDLVLIILVNLCVFTNHIMSLSTFPFYIQDLGGSEALSGACAALFSLVAVLVRPFVGWWLDNGARRAVLIIGLLGLALAPAGYVAVPMLSVALVFRMVHGAALSFSNSTTATGRLRRHLQAALRGGHGLLWHGDCVGLGHRARARPRAHGLRL